MWWAVLVCALSGIIRVQSVAEGQPHNALYYRIHLDSFRDSDGDGLGDFQGATKQLSYVRALGADSVILSTIFTKSTNCEKPGILNFNTIDPRYGSDEHFNIFLAKARKLELNVLMSLPLQSMSTDAEWFKSADNQINGFNDWVLWRNINDTSEVHPGVDWVLSENNSTLFAMSEKEVVLNICSQGLQDALMDSVCSWVNMGVSGVVITPGIEDCSLTFVTKLSSKLTYCTKFTTIGVASPTIIVDVTKYNLNQEEASSFLSCGAHSVISGALASPKISSTADMTVSILSTLVYNSDANGACWITSTPTGSHIATRYGSNMIDGINILAMMLPGSPIIYQGDELGVADTLLEWMTPNDICWPSQVSSIGVPFPWDGTANAGFTTGEPWLPIPPNARYANAKAQFNNQESHFGVIRLAAAMRKTSAFGPHCEIKRIGNTISVLRWGGSGSLLALCNLGKDRAELKASSIPGIPPEMVVVVSSYTSGMNIGSRLNSEAIVKLGPGEAVLLIGPSRHCGGPGPVDKITNKLQEGWQKINKYFNN